MKTRPDSDSRIRAWLGRAFMLQVALISIAAVVGVFMASVLLEGVLIRAALNDEVKGLRHEREEVRQRIARLVEVLDGLGE